MKIIVLFALCVGYAFLNPTSAFGCLCEPEPTNRAIKRLVKESTMIFVGTVKEITKEKLGYKATLTIERLWKGALAEEITIQTEGGCMAWFEIGRNYLVYAAKDSSGNLITNVCMRTRLTEYATEDLKRLGKPKVQRTVCATSGFHQQIRACN